MTAETAEAIRHMYRKVRSTYKVAALTGIPRSTVRLAVIADRRISMSPVGRPTKEVTAARG